MIDRPRVVYFYSAAVVYFHSALDIQTSLHHNALRLHVRKKVKQVKKTHLGLFQISQNRFAVAVHADGKPFARQEFSIADATMRFGEDPPPESEDSDLNPIFRFTLQSLEELGSQSIDASLMSLNTCSDWISWTIIRNGTAAYRVALAMTKFAPLACARLDEELLLYVRHMLPPDHRSPSRWHIVHPALLLQCAEIFYPDSSTPVDSCASLAARPELLDYVTALGDTFSITDIEGLAQVGQTSSSRVIANASSISGSTGYHIYKVRLRKRAIENAGLLKLSYVRARARHAKGLLERTRNRMGTGAGDKFRADHLDHLSHHLAILHVCAEFGIHLSVGPFVTMDLDKP